MTQSNISPLPAIVARNLEIAFGLATNRCRTCRHFDEYLADPERGECGKRRAGRTGAGVGGCIGPRIVTADQSCHRFEQRR